MTLRVSLPAPTADCEQFFLDTARNADAVAVFDGGQWVATVAPRNYAKLIAKRDQSGVLRWMLVEAILRRDPHVTMEQQ